METDVSVESETVEAPGGAQQESAEDLAGFVADESVSTEPAEAREPIPDIVEKVAFNPLTSDIDDDELKLDGFYKDLNEEHIKDLPTTAKRMLHNFRNAYKMREQDLDRTLEDKERDLAGRMESLGKLERDFARRQAEISVVTSDPEIQKLLNPQKSERALDPYTPEGLNAMVEQRVADGLRKVLEPMNQAADMNQRTNMLLDFVSQHPEMRSPSFKKEVVSVVKQRWDTDQRISTEDAFQLVKARRVLAKEQVRAQQETAARAKSARRVARKTSSGSPTSDNIPREVRRRGAGAIVNWLRDNPEAAKRLHSQFS
jgi:hypothetical protein